MSYVALLRGVNVGKHNRISMKALRVVFADLGAENVATYLQSGNVVFDSRVGVARLVPAIEQEIARGLGVRASVVLRTSAQLSTVVARNPFGSERDLKKLHVAFLASKPDRTHIRDLDPSETAPDELRLAGQDVYLHYPSGYGRSKLTNAYLERRLGVAATMRNWNTVTALAELAASA